MTGVAVIGLACRFPGARNSGEFWRNLRDGVESISVLSDDELREAGIAPELIAHPQYVKAAPLLDGIDQFDAPFFGFNPREAEILDVQIRLFLECAWEALEDACCDPQRYAGAIGVYAGAGMNAYLLSNLLPHRALLAAVGEFQTLISNDKDFLPTRVSYKLNLRGPSVSVQTACSTSLVAIHLACQALLSGECDVALAGGVSVRVPQKAGYLYQDGMILSPDGHCRAFDARAAGTVPGSGVGIVVLKRLEDALADGDRVDAVVRGSAVNNDGAIKVGYTAPSIDGQRAVIREALAVAGVLPDSIGMVEAHGTGTTLGDPVEFAALREAFQPAGQRSQPCVLGAVKTNVGHLDAAAGVAGFIKTVFALRHRLIPPALHFTSPNPQIDLDSAGFRINTRAEPWPECGAARRAGVSSFGIGGTNAHVILEEGPVRPRDRTERDAHVIVLSARTDQALATHRVAVAHALAEQSEVTIADAAWSLQTGRQAFGCRAATVSRSRADAVTRLELGDVEHGIARPRSVVFMFPGQGAQFAGMAEELYQLETTFRSSVDRCCDLLRSSLGFDLRELLLAGDAPDRDARLKQTAVAQPAIFIVEYALAQQLRAWGVEPAALIGHSVGEYTAACVSGAIALEDVLPLIAIRGQFMQQLPGGCMLAVATSAERLATLCGGAIAVAAMNAPQLAVASGPADAIASLVQTCASLNIECHHLETSHAFHSAMMEPIQPEYSRALARVTFSPPTIPWASNVTGTWITATEAVDPAYWLRHVRSRVLFSSGVDCVMQLPNPVLLEVGPGRTLSTLAAAHPAARDAAVIATMRHRRGGSTEADGLMHALARLWVAGVDVKWAALDRNQSRQRVGLPTYPFERQRYWIDPPREARSSATAQAHIDEPERRALDEWFYVPSWRCAPAPSGSAADQRAAAWLVFVQPGNAITEGLVTRLRASGADPIVVSAGSGYACGERTYTVRPAEASDYSLLLAELARRGVTPRHIVHAWMVDRDRSGTNVLDLQDALDEGFFSLVALTRALGAYDAHELRLQVLSSRIHALGGEDSVLPARATLLGPVLVIPRECPTIQCRSIDYTLPLGRVAESRLIDLLYAELLSDARDQIVAYRNNQRRVRTLDRVSLDETRNRPPIRTNAHYLVTGGLGGVGYVLAEHLGRSARARLTLIGRSRVNPDDPRLQQLERTGVSVMSIAADVGDTERLRAAVDEAEARFGPVRGVIHAAGIPGGGLIQRRTRNEIDAVFRPKLAGALNIARVFAPGSLDFLVFVSSLTGVIGETGQVDYCAAGAYLDACAHELRAAGHNACSVDWDTWQQVGMAASATVPEALQSRRDESLRLGIANTEGCEAFDRVLTAQLSQVAVSTRDPELRMRRDLRAVKELTADELPPSSLRHPRPAVATPFAGATTPQEEALCRIWEGLLGVDAIGVDDNFFDLGGHSLLATQVLSRVRDRLGVRVSLAAFFENPSVRQLAGLIEARQLEAVLAEVSALTEEDAARELGRN